MPLSAGKKLGVYEVVSALGVGGMGEVYRARDTKLNRDVALKVLPEAFASDPERIARFHREAQVLASLNHPGIAHIHGLEDSAGVRAIIMELVDGPTLTDRLKQGRIPVNEAIRIARHIAEAIEAAHEKGIVHRDLKPANIKLSADGTQVKVLDFGLATIVKASEDPVIGNPDMPTRMPTVTEAGLILGTPAYMSPEQARGQPADKRADIWAFGVVLFEILSGKRAYDGATTTDILAGIVTRQPDWTLLPADTPLAARQLLARCLEKDAHRRLRDIGEARVSLTDPPGSSPPAVTKEHVAPSRRLAWWVTVLVSFALVTILVTLAFTRIGGDRASEPAAIASGPFRLVVLPFENLSRQPGDDWMAGAFSDSLTLGLQGLENIVLVNRERLRELESNHDSNPQQAAQVLGVRYYVSGSFQRVGDDLKVIAWLVDVQEGGAIRHQEPITDRFTNLLQIEDQLARRFASALQQSAVIPRRTSKPSMRAYQAVAQANDLYLEARYAEAVEKLEIATAEDERYADAWALLGKSYAQQRAPGSIEDRTRSELLGRALSASQRAIDLDPLLYDGRLALAIAYQQLEEAESWRDNARKAIDMNPRLAEAYVVLGDSYGASPAFGCLRKRDTEMAVSYYRKALDLNPSFGPAHARLATTLYWSGREEEGLAVLKDAISRQPGSLLLNRGLGGGFLWSGRADELEKQLQKLGTMASPTVLDKWMMGALHLFRGRTNEAATTFKEVIEAGPAILREIDTGRLYAKVGRMEDAAQHLQRAFSLDPGCATFVRESGAFAPYRDHAAFRNLLSRYPETK